MDARAKPPSERMRNQLRSFSTLSSLIVALIVAGCTTGALFERRVTVVFPPVAAPAYEQGCVMDKLSTPDFRQTFLTHHDDLTVLLDVDKEYALFLHDSDLPDARSTSQREQYVHELSRNLAAAKEQRLAGSRFRIERSLDLGPEVVVRAEGWADICELTNNPHVIRVWLNVPTRLL